MQKVVLCEQNVKLASKLQKMPACCFGEAPSKARVRTLSDVLTRHVVVLRKARA